MEEAMEHDPQGNVIRVAYPFTVAADKQPNNYHQVVKVQGKIEERVRKEGLTVIYNEEMDRMIDSGAVRELSQQEMREHQGGCTICPTFPCLILSRAAPSCA